MATHVVCGTATTTAASVNAPARDFTENAWTMLEVFNSAATGGGNLGVRSKAGTAVIGADETSSVPPQTSMSVPWAPTLSLIASAGSVTYEIRGTYR